MLQRNVLAIRWTNKRERKAFEAGINGYTLIYDERPKRSWEEWIRK